MEMNFLVSILVTILVCSPNTTGIDSRFPTNRNGEMFTNMVVNDTVYVAENGWINLLDTNLLPLGRFPTCVGDNCVNINKVLSVFRDVLILCGTGNAGICQIWNGTHFSYNSTTTASENYLVVSSSVERPAVGLVHENDIILGVTYGPEIIKTDNTYKHLLSRRGIKKSFSTFGFVDLKHEIYENYLVYFKKVFEHEGFIYFLTNQRLNTYSERYVSKLVRMCINETIANRHTMHPLESYTDIVMSCYVDGKDYNLLQDAEFLPVKRILVAAFAQGTDPEKPQPGNALCIYTVDRVNDAMLNAKEDFITCNITGYVDRESAYLDIDLPQCLTLNDYGALKDNYTCPKEGHGTKVIGTVTLHPASTYMSEDSSTTVTTVSGVERYGLYPDVFLGTDKGTIIKIGVDENLSVSSHGHEIIDTGHPIKDIHFGPDYVYILSDRRVFKAQDTDCSVFKTCRETIERKDPLCGWCLEANRSTKRSKCSQTWLSSFSECVSIEASPKFISSGIRNFVDINITAKNFPMGQTSNLKCRYLNGNEQIGQVLETISISKDVFMCKSPSDFEHGTLRLQILFLASNELFLLAETTLEIYNCDTFQTCASCMVSKEVYCSWCTTTLQCSDNCVGSSLSQGEVERCPNLLPNRDMYIPGGIQTNVTIRAENLVQGIGYQCVVKLMNHSIEKFATADFKQDTLTCLLEVTSVNNAAKEEFPVYVFQVTGSIQAEILNEYAPYVTVYKCEYLATDCIMCNALNSSRFECHWCQDGHCGHKSACNNAVTCPPPRITAINPSVGGFKGHTIITISGTDFGTDPSGVQDVQLVPLFETHARFSCPGVQIIQNDDSDFHPVNKEIRCRVKSVYICSCYEFDGLVNLTFDYEGIRAEPGSYRLAIPIVTHIEPIFGPISGGTVITITGTDLMIGNSLSQVRLGTVFCRNITLNLNRLMCTTHAVTRSLNSTLVLKIDGVSYHFHGVVYSYVNNPVIEDISSQTTILSGGTNITISGQNLNNARETNIKVRYADSEEVRNCSNLSSGMTICPVPDAPDILREEMEENLNASDASPTVDNRRISADAFINLSGFIKTFTIQYFRNPSISTIGGEGSVVEVDSSNRELLINGQNMNMGAGVADYTISIGQTGNCDEIILTINNLTCVLPATSPGPDNENMEVIVSIGNFKRPVGYVIYRKSIKDDSTYNIALLIGISISVFLVLLIIIGTVVFCIRYRRVKARTPQMRKAGTTDQNTSFPTNRTSSTGDHFTRQSTFVELHLQNPGPDYDNFDQNKDDGRRN